MRNDVITLIREHFSQDHLGIWQEPEETSRDVFAEVRSAGRAEFFKAAQIGNRCSYVFLVFSLDYEGESIVQWNGRRYSIYRTFQNIAKDVVELYAEERAGVTDGGKQAEGQSHRPLQKRGHDSG